MYSEEVSIHQKPADNDPNLYFDKSIPFSVKVEAPDCSSGEEDAAKVGDIPMGPLKPKKCHTNSAVKG